ncbi:3-methyl-2-oxobutanoate hydroxymethyltransferase [Prochlorococcus sp. MIT 1307]|uniref:3-methyl-2-oxobutanoate hydroxymethyltransferase n=1 Tax=Prochlorococcus sp. MIT 1307 TaxID=3096219 RepID=UPI002A75A793|nr:3-methyl-2-oxobutanoate hydroxymethyltransferase [Prochlorococcus sp. MIT 1307]
MLPAELIRFKQTGRSITVLTAWDSISSSIVEAAGADVVLVGDSLAMVILGHATTLPVTLEQMLHHTQAVGRGFKKPLNEQPLVICDLPFLSYQCGEDKAVAAAGFLIKNSCAAAVKIEGAEPEVLKVIERLIRMGIPVMGHLGLTPQSVHNLGYRRQAEDKASQEKLLSQALQLQKAGCFGLVLEHVPEEVANHQSNQLKIPVIGIGAGKNCDGQVRVTADLLGLSEKQPPFSQPLIEGRQLFVKALQNWVQQQHLQEENPTKEASE